jgi:hypothetical protein
MHAGRRAFSLQCRGGIGGLLVQGICDVWADDVFVSEGGGGCGGVNVNVQCAACRDKGQGATQQRAVFNYSAVRRERSSEPRESKAETHKTAKVQALLVPAHFHCTPHGIGSAVFALARRGAGAGAGRSLNMALPLSCRTPARPSRRTANTGGCP